MINASRHSPLASDGGRRVLEVVKELLKRVPWLYAINGYIKCWRIRRVYAATVARYRWRAVSGRATRSGTTALASCLCPGAVRPNIFFLGTDEAQDRSGLLQALERIGHVTVYRRADGSYGHNPVRNRNWRQENSDRLIEMFTALARAGRTPHLLISQTWGGYVDPTVFSRIRSEWGTTVINIAMDDRHQYLAQRIRGEWWGTRGLTPHINLALTAAPECVDWYLKEGCPAMYFPEASDPEIFRPMPALPKTHDITFVGARYGIRERIVSVLRRAGIRVTAFGNGWEHGRIGTEEVPRLFAQSRIVLGVSAIGHCDDFVALKLRDFDGPMSGTCYLTQANPDLAAHYEIGKEIVTYCDVDECVDNARHLLSHEDERESIARAGRLRAAREHSWDTRFSTVFGALRANSGMH